MDPIDTYTRATNAVYELYVLAADAAQLRALREDHFRILQRVIAMKERYYDRWRRTEHNRDRWRWLAQQYRRRAKEAREAERERVLAIVQRWRSECPYFTAASAVLRQLEDEVTRG